MNGKEKHDFLIQNIKGIGEQKVSKVIELFPDVDDILDITKIDNAYKILNSAFSKKLSESILKQLIDIRSKGENVELLTSCGVPYYSALELVKQEETFKKFLENPYIIGRNNDISFTALDNFAHRTCDEFKSPDMGLSRMESLIDFSLRALESSGHTYAYIYQIVNKINQYQKAHSYGPTDYRASTILLYIQNKDMFVIEAQNTDIEKWIVYRKETYVLENDIAYHIKRLKTNTVISKDVNWEHKGIRYDKVQMTAIESANMSGMKVITGPPGSGKTAVINGIISYFKCCKPGAEIVLCAPTGRAAKHMAEITGHQASTIHHLLGIGSFRRIFSNNEKLTADMVICDESSMLNLDVTFELLRRIKTGTVVYLVGDKDQLPAVGAGNVLHDIINSGCVPVYKLEKVYRQDGTILENAHRINSGKTDVVKDDFYVEERFEDASKMKERALELFNQYYDVNEPFETQILVPSYKAEVGIDSLNETIQSNSDELFVYSSKVEGSSYKKNDKILMIKNNKDGLYQNGSVGLFLSNMQDSIRVNFEGEEMELPKTSLADMKLGYAISVHKSQGSEYKHVILCLPEEPVSMLKRNIVYTAITRAKKDVHVLIMNNAFETAVNTNDEPYMQTGLVKKLQQ